MKFRRRPFRLTIDGDVVDSFRTLAEAKTAQKAHGDYRARYSIHERVGSRYFNVCCGWKAGTTSTADLVAMGLPVHPPLINHDVL